MENLTKIGIFLFLLCVCGSVSCRSMPPVRHYTLDRINIKRTDLKHICDTKGANLYEDIYTKHISFTMNLTEKFMSWKKEIGSSDDVYKLVQERCIKDMSLKDMLKKFIESAQLCMEEKDRLKDEKLQAVTSRLMELFCAQYTHSHAFSSDEDCLNLVTNAAIDTCKEKYKTDQFIPLPFIYNNKECNDYQKYSECRLEAMKSCKDATKTAVEAADSIMFHTFYGCHNISVIPEKITIKRSPVYPGSPGDTEEIIRFNMTLKELEEKCSLNAGANYVNVIVRESFVTSLMLLTKVQGTFLLKAKIFNIMDPELQDNLLHESCFNNSEVIKALEEIYEIVQLCIPKEEQFSEEKKAKLLKQSLNEVCANFKSGMRLISNGEGCFQDLKMLFKLILCETRNSAQNGFYNLLLPFKHTTEECNLIDKRRECQLNLLSDCEDSTKLIYHSRFDELKKFLGCDNPSYNSSPPNG